MYGMINSEKISPIEKRWQKRMQNLHKRNLDNSRSIVG